MNLDLAPQIVEAIEGFLAKRNLADVPGLIRKHHNVIVSRADVIEIYNRIATTKLGRTMKAAILDSVSDVPADFAEHAAVENNTALRARYGNVSVNIITRWRNETGVKAPPSPGTPQIPAPDGFKLIAPTMTMKQLRMHYGRGVDMIGRWLNETGTKPKTLQYGYRNGPVNTTLRDMTKAGQAADFLKRWCPVYRCDERGRLKGSGSMWRYGDTVVTPAGLIERAEAKGFDPNAWQRLAA